MASSNDHPAFGRMRARRGPHPGVNAAALLLLLLLCAAALLFAYHGWQALWFRYGLDYGEGPLLDQTTRLARGENIYRADLSRAPFTISNYPPLFVLAQVPLFQLFGPAFWYGRAIAWLSAVVTALCIGGAVRALSGDWLAAWVAGLLLLAIPYVSYWSMFNRIDGLALAFSWLGLFVLLRWNERRWSLAVGAALLVAAIYTKQTYGLAAPLAAGVCLLAQRRWRRALVLAGLVGGTCALLFVLLDFGSGGGFWFNIITANINAYRVDQVGSFAREAGQWLPVLLGASAVFLLTNTRRTNGWWLIMPYTVGALGTALAVGKVGANANYLLELSAVLCLGCGALLAWLRTRPALRGALLLLLALQVGWLLPGTHYQRFTASKLANAANQAQLEQAVRGANGLVLADEDMALLPLAGHPIILQPFELTQLANAGLWNQQPLIDAIDRRSFALILLFEPGGSGDLVRDRWTPDMLAAIGRTYRYVQQYGGTALYVPR